MYFLYPTLNHHKIDEFYNLMSSKSTVILLYREGKAEKEHLVETKADKDLNDPMVLLKAKAAHAWCINASKVPPANTLSQPQEFEYLVLPEGLFKANSGLGFNMFIPLCRGVRNRMIETFENTIRRQKSGS